LTLDMAATQRWVLVLNCGSSSVRFALVCPQTGERRVSGLAERVGTRDAVVHLTRADERHTTAPSDGSYHGVVRHLLAALTAAERSAIVGVGHRVVQGGDRFVASIPIDGQVVRELHDLSDLAPLHMPANLAGIEAARAALPDRPHVAVFDTAFHQTMPPVAYRYAVPAEWYDEHHVRRYGFHGTSHRYVSARAAELLGRGDDPVRLVTLHLGNGCSAAAVRGGVCLDTTMGMTPLEGLVMGTRSGDVDPGVLGHIGVKLGLDLAAVLDILNHRSGLLGVSGVSSDCRTVVDAAEHGSAAAALAIELFCYRAAKAVGALAVPLGGLDAVVFTGGIGEHAPEIRRGVLDRLAVFGLTEDPAANADHGRSTGGRISTAGAVVALVVPTDEEFVIAQDTDELVA
jgi:acetate kinase